MSCPPASIFFRGSVWICENLAFPIPRLHLLGTMGNDSCLLWSAAFWVTELAWLRWCVSGFGSGSRRDCWSVAALVRRWMGRRQTTINQLFIRVVGVAGTLLGSECIGLAVVERATRAHAILQI